MTELAVIKQQIIDAAALVVKRFSDNGMVISEGAKVVGTSFRSDSFNEAVTALVMPDVRVSDVAHIKLRHVEPPTEFTTVRVGEYFNLGFYSADNKLLGGREIVADKSRVAQMLTDKLALS